MTVTSWSPHPSLLVPGLKDLVGDSGGGAGKGSTCFSWHGLLSIFGAGERTGDCIIWDLHREECAFLASNGAGECPLRMLARKKKSSLMSTHAQTTVRAAEGQEDAADGSAAEPVWPLPLLPTAGEADTSPQPARSVRPASVASADLRRGCWRRAEPGHSPASTPAQRPLAAPSQQPEARPRAARAKSGSLRPFKTPGENGGGLMAAAPSLTNSVGVGSVDIRAPAVQGGAGKAQSGRVRGPGPQSSPAARPREDASSLLSKGS